jgi:hypothetical protein
MHAGALSYLVSGSSADIIATQHKQHGLRDAREPRNDEASKRSSESEGDGGSNVVESTRHLVRLHVCVVQVGPDAPHHHVAEHCARAGGRMGVHAGVNVCSWDEYE